MVCLCFVRSERVQLAKVSGGGFGAMNAVEYGGILVVVFEPTTRGIWHGGCGRLYFVDHYMVYDASIDIGMGRYIGHAKGLLFGSRSLGRTKRRFDANVIRGRRKTFK